MKNIDLQTKPLRSQPTRDRILKAATRIFGREGYDHATIRAIAAEADINPAMVMRYYGSKEALFVAATKFDVDHSALASIAKDQYGETIVRRVLQNWEDPQTGPARRAMLLASMTNETARAKFVDEATEQYRELLRAFGATENLQRVAVLIAAQVVGLVVMRYILRSPAMLAQTHEQLIREIGRTIQNYLAQLH
jgi:AcrR family transcriptional regulator